MCCGMDAGAGGSCGCGGFGGACPARGGAWLPRRFAHTKFARDRIATAHHTHYAGEKALGDVAPAMAPAGLTQSQWDSLTAEQKAAYTSADIANQAKIRDLVANGITGGLKAAVDLITAAMKQGDAEAQRKFDLELAKLEHAKDLEQQRIASARDVELAKLGKYPSDTQQKGEEETPPTTKKSGFMVPLIIGAILLAAS